MSAHDAPPLDTLAPLILAGLPLTPAHVALAARLTPAQLLAAAAALARTDPRDRGGLATWRVTRTGSAGTDTWLAYVGLGEAVPDLDRLSALLVAAGAWADPGTGELRPLRPPDVEPA